MDLNTIEFSIREQVAYIWLNRPEKRNALNAAMLAELSSLFESISGQQEARILVLRGRGKVFCAGADLAFMGDISNKSEGVLQEEAALFFDCFESLYRLPVPVICFAHGGVHGGANGLVAASDFVLCTEDTRFSFSEVRLGLVPATVAPFVLRRMGSVKTRQYMISGEIMDGMEAYSGGLVDHLVRQEDADREIEKLAGLLKQNAPGAVSMTKKLLIDIEHKAINRELRSMTTEMITRARDSDEAREGLDAFFNKRTPNWRNKE
jgi:methylglutaconyl-CoA hydratase